MRINKFLAQATGLSRRRADEFISSGRIQVNGTTAAIGYEVKPGDKVMLDGKIVELPAEFATIILNKPVGYVTSREGQGSKTIYDLLPKELHHLKPVGRLDKDSSGLLLLTNDGELANQLTHPRYTKEKVYEIEIDRPLSKKNFDLITKVGVDIGDTRLSKMQLAKISHFRDDRKYLVQLSEGRNRQIRRTLAALGYTVTKLHRTVFAEFDTTKLEVGTWQKLRNM